MSENVGYFWKTESGAVHWAIEMVGLPELLLVFVLAGAPIATVLVLAGPRSLRKALYRFQRYHAVSEYHNDSPYTTQRLAAKVALPVFVAVVVAVWSISVGLVAPQEGYIGTAPLVGRLLGLTLVVYALVLHIRCRSRAKKYAAFIGGLVAISTGTWIGLAASARLDRQSSSWTLVSSLVLIHPVTIMFAGVSALCYWARIAHSRQDSPEFLRRSYRIVTLPNPLVLALVSWCFGTWLVLLYCLARFVIVEQALTRPLLYLRAFHYADGPQAFAKVIAPAAGHYGPFVVLVHRTQGPDAILPGLSSNRIVQTVASPDDRWRECVTRHLDGCVAAIFDLTQSTQSLGWELEESLRVIGAGRTIAVCQNGYETTLTTSVAALPYDIAHPIESREGIRARMEHAAA